jgi:hypothetical protein
MLVPISFMCFYLLFRRLLWGHRTLLTAGFSAAKSKKLSALFHEISSSEETYLSGLDTLLNTYLLPITNILIRSHDKMVPLFEETVYRTFCLFDSFCAIET